MTIAHTAGRIRRYSRQHGVRATLAFLLSRVVRHQQHVVFDMDLSAAPAAPDWNITQRVLVIGPENVDSAISPELYRFLGGDGAVENLQGLREGNRLFVVSNGDTFQHCGYILMKTRETSLLAERFGTPLIACCFTPTGARRQGIYRRALQEEVAYLGQQGFRRVIIETTPDNTASIRGIEAAGFRLCRRVSAWIILNHIGFARIVESSGERRTRLFGL
jgi:hypothetical protein